MRTHIKPVFIFYLIVVLVISSCASRRLANKAEEMEQEGMHEEAAEFYYQALVENTSNTDALAGLKRTGEKRLSNKLARFEEAYNQQNNREAVYYYLDAQEYYEKVKSVNVNLNFPSVYNGYYNEVSELYLEDKYFEAVNHLDDGSFSRAESLFREIKEIEPNYRDVNEQIDKAIYEPVYREGLFLMENREYRDAYYKFDKIINNLGTYRDSHNLRKESLEKGSFTITLAPAKYPPIRRGVEINLENEVLNKLQNLDNPFIRLIEKSGVYERVAGRDESSFGLATTDATLYCEVNSFNYQPGELDEEEKRGYLKREVEKEDYETGEKYYETEYVKVTYKEYEKNRSVTLTVSFRLINERSGEIYISGSKTFNTQDKINYAKYRGNEDSLVPGYWKHQRRDSDEDVISDSRRAVNQLRELLNSRQEIKDQRLLISEAVNNASIFIAEEVNETIN